MWILGFQFRVSGFTEFLLAPVGTTTRELKIPRRFQVSEFEHFRNFYYHRDINTFSSWYGTILAGVFSEQNKTNKV